MLSLHHFVNRYELWISTPQYLTEDTFSNLLATLAYGMDLAYDFIQEDPNRKEGEESKDGSNNDRPQQSLNSEIQDAYRAFSSSPWGVSLGGFLGNVRKQVCISRSQSYALGGSLSDARIG